MYFNKMNKKDCSSNIDSNHIGISTNCLSDSVSGLSSMDYDIWTLNATNMTANLHEEGSNLVQTSNINEIKSYSSEANEMYSDDLNLISSNGTSFHEFNSNYSETDPYNFNTIGSNQRLHNCFQVSSLPTYTQSSNSRVSTPFTNIGPSYTSSSTNTVNKLAYALHPTISRNSNHCTSSSSHNLSYLSNSSSNGNFSVTQPAIFPTASMSVNLSMNMTMGFNTDTQLQWSGQNVNYNVHPSHQTSNQSFYETIYNSSYSSPPASCTFTAEFMPSSSSSIYSAQPSSPITEKTHADNDLRCSYSKSKINHDFSVIQGISKSSEEAYTKMSTSNSTSNLCKLCGKTYARPSTLKTHMRTHSGERPYRCDTCHKSFSQAANLTAHIRTHNGEKPFCCPVCYRKFSQSSSVTTHMRTHSGERPYRCCVCKKAFSDSSTLTKHLRIHSGEKPYQCKLCSLRFSQSGNLNRHMRIHNYN